MNRITIRRAPHMSAPHAYVCLDEWPTRYVLFYAHGLCFSLKNRPSLKSNVNSVAWACVFRAQSVCIDRWSEYGEHNGRWNRTRINIYRRQIRCDKQPAKRRDIEGKKRQVIVHSLNFRSAQSGTWAEPERSPPAAKRISTKIQCECFHFVGPLFFLFLLSRTFIVSASS